MPRQAILLPGERWDKCGKCKAAIPVFELAEELGRELKHLVEHHPGLAMARLIQGSGCSPTLAKRWTIHHVPTYEAVPTLCPWCGGALRTRKAKQCRFCGRDWH